MLKWSYVQLKDGITFQDVYDYSELVQLRHDIVSLDAVPIDGTIMFDTYKGFIKIKFTISAQVIAADTGNIVSFEMEECFDEQIDSSIEEIILAEEQMIDLSRYVEMLIDTAIPSYIFEHESHLEEKKTSEKEVIDQSRNQLSILSKILAEKNNK